MKYRSDYLGRMQWIEYPDGERIVYGYDNGGQVISVTGEHWNKNFEYVTNIFYDQYGQRTRIDYGNGTFTEYNYDAKRRWLDTIKTYKADNSGNPLKTYQNITYNFDAVGNVNWYENNCIDSVRGNYKTRQEYTYDNLYQLIKVEGKSTYNPDIGNIPEYVSEYSQTFTFDDDGFGKIMNKKSTESIVPYRKIGDNLKYEFDYEYDVENYTHRRIRAGNLFYKYDDNGNIICEQDGSFDSNDDDGTYHKIQEESDEVYSTDYGWGLFRDDGTDIKGKHIRYKRMYSWNERNMLVFSEDASHSTSYIYGHDGQRTNKYTRSSETLYFNNMWTLHTDAGNNDYGGQYAKNVYLGETRIVTKLYLKNDPRVDAEEVQQYFYHSDHLGSASLISDYKGDEYQRIEYTPYGETWIERTDNKGVDYLPYRFTSKELDEETGLYYYGARYLDPKYSTWISTDPALGDYIPQAPINDEARRHNQNLPGMGGIFNHINNNLYHYAGNNPVRYIDPDGNDFVPHEIQQKIKTLTMLKAIAEQIKRTDCASGVKLYQTEKGNCCFARACLVANELRQYGYEVVYTYVRNPRNGTSFPYHVAAAVKTQDGELYVIDPIFRKGFYLNKDWVSMQEPEKTNPGNFPKKGVLYKGHYECYEVLNEYRRYLERTGKSEEEVSLYSFCQKLIEHYYETGDVNLND